MFAIANYHERGGEISSWPLEMIKNGKKMDKIGWVYTNLEGKKVKVGKKVWVYTDLEEKNGKSRKNLQGQY